MSAAAIVTELNCAKCGACAPVCPVFRAEGRESLTARGRMHLLAAADEPNSAPFADIFSRCLLCGACEQVCPRRLPIRRLIVQARSRLPLLRGPHDLRKALACSVLGRPALLDGLAKAGISLRRLLNLPADSGLRLTLLEDRQATPLIQAVDQAEQSGGDLSYFVGCFARHLQPSIAEATATLLRSCGLTAHVPAAQACCGLAAWSCGSIARARDLAMRNILAFAGKGPILASCASCSAHLLAYPALFDADDPWQARAHAFAGRVREFSTFFDGTLPLPKRSAGPRVFWHDPCHLRFAPDGLASPRRLLKQTGCIVLEPADSPLCCGQGGLFHLSCPATSAKIFAACRRQALADQPDCIATTCSGCLMQYQIGLTAQERPIRIAHLAVLLAERLAQAVPQTI